VVSEGSNIFILGFNIFYVSESCSDLLLHIVGYIELHYRFTMGTLSNGMLHQKEEVYS
jgi:hypothetical protein